MLNILIVDDDPTIIELLKNKLSSSGSIEVADNGVTAFKAYTSILKNQKKYDIIISDIAMPQMDGIQLLKLIREEEKFQNAPKTPVILMTAYPKRLIDEIEHLWDDYLLKPFDMGEMLEKINNLTSG